MAALSVELAERVSCVSLLPLYKSPPRVFVGFGLGVLVDGTGVLVGGTGVGTGVLVAVAVGVGAGVLVAVAVGVGGSMTV